MMMVTEAIKYQPVYELVGTSDYADLNPCHIRLEKMHQNWEFCSH